jgi:hypothetical protein
MRRTLIGAVVALGLALAAAPAALGAGTVENFREHIDVVIEDFDLCGFATTAHIQRTVVEKHTTGADGLLYIDLLIQDSDTFTSTDTGAMLVVTSAERSRDISVTAGDNTITETFALTGTLFFRDGDNNLINKRAGRIIYSDVINLNGTPNDDSDDFLESFSIDFVAGPHPFAEGGITCDSAEQVFG